MRGEDIYKDKIRPSHEVTDVIHWNERRLVVNGLMKAFKVNKRFEGAYDDDLCEFPALYENPAQMCKVTSQGMKDGMPLFPNGDALLYFSAQEI